MGRYSKGRDVEITEFGDGKEMSEEDAVEMMVWEINTAKGFVASFQKLLGAHSFILSILATVNLIAFLQPPKGWNQSPVDDSTSHLNAMSVMYNTGSMEAYAIASSLSLYSAISGLLFYLYCSQDGVTSLEDAELPKQTETDHKQRNANIEILHRTRAYLHHLVLPGIRRSSRILSFFLAASLTFSLIAFISSGYAASSPNERLHYVVIPAVPGCILVLFCFVLAVLKHGHDLDFDTQFDNFWLHAVPVEMKPPDIRTLSYDAKMALDRSVLPFPKACKTQHISPKH